MTDDDLKKQVADFARTYIFPVINKAHEAGEDPHIAIFAMMECIRMIISSSIADRDEAIEEFKSFVEYYVSDWKSAPRREAPGSM